VFRKFLSELFFNASLGNGFYSDLSAGTFVVLIIFIILSFLLIKYSEYIKVEFLFCLGLLLSSITTINVLRYKPYGGDAKIYCDLTFYQNQAICQYMMLNISTPLITHLFLDNY